MAMRTALALWAAVTDASWLLFGCTGAQPANPIAEYLRGVEDAVRQAAPERMPTIVVTWNEDAPGFGACRIVAGERLVYVHAGRILRVARTVEEARSLITDVLVHELGHAALSCSDADHQELAP